MSSLLRRSECAFLGLRLIPLTYRISHLELLDEVEELNLVLQHYAITWGANTFMPLAKLSPWETWGLKMPPQAPFDG